MSTDPKALVAELRDDASYNRDVAQLSERPIAAWQADLLDSAQVADKAAACIEQLQRERDDARELFELCAKANAKAESALAAATAERDAIHRDHEQVKYALTHAETSAQSANLQLADTEKECDRLQRIAWLIGSIYVHGKFVAETANERELESLLRANGTFWESLEAFDAALPKAKGAT